MVRAAIRAGVKRVLALSTDKAASPINLYGASKLASDKIFVAANNMAPNGPQFSVARYGNVMGSRGSVVPVFRRMIAKGVKELPITDPRMTRFNITLDDGVAFVISCLERMNGGEIFVPKIPSLRVVDLARAIAPEVPVKIVGIRPGEKLHESMITVDDARATVEFDDHYVILPSRPYQSTPIPTAGRPVAEGFEYKSDTNPIFLSVDDLVAILEKHNL
jgi:UDP-N-acetylglucosamine 4,6-dehydratase